MGRRRRGDSARPKGPRPNREHAPVEDAESLAEGDIAVEFVPDEHGGVTVMVGGHPQSHLDPDDPEHLVFEYVQHFAAAIDAVHPAPEPLTVTHIGGAGLTLPRWVHATRPGSPQIVLEPDTALTEAVRARLPLPRGHRIRLRGTDGRAGVGVLGTASAQVVVIDAFADARVPSELLTTEFFAEAGRVIGEGLLLMNAPDEAGLAHVARVVAGVAAGMGAGTQVCLVATRDVVKRRRYGNAVIGASLRPLPIDEIRRQVARWPFPSGVIPPAEVAAMIRSARPYRDGDDAVAPAAPELGQWRLR